MFEVSLVYVTRHFIIFFNQIKAVDFFPSLPPSLSLLPSLQSAEPFFLNFKQTPAHLPFTLYQQSPTPVARILWLILKHSACGSVKYAKDLLKEREREKI